MPVDMLCPRCGADHLHAAVYLRAEQNDRFEVIGLGPTTDGRVRVKRNIAGTIKDPDEVCLTCCACDWTDDAFIEWVP